MQYVFHEPEDYGFQDRDGHDGKFFATNSPLTSHLIIECKDKLEVSLIQQEAEFDYYVVEGSGYFILNDEQQAVKQGDLVVIPPGTKYSFGGTLKMLLINTPHRDVAKETIIHDR